MAKISTIRDNFNDNSLNGTLWNTDAAVETGGQLQIPANTSSGSYNYLVSNATYDLTDSSIYVELVNKGSYVGGIEVYPLDLYSDNGDEAMWSIEGGTDIVAYKSPDFGTYTELYRGTYSSTTHRWFRIRVASGVTYWDTSPDGVTWTNRASNSTGYTQTAIYATVGLLNPSSGSTTVIIDNLNSIGTSISASALSTSAAVPTPTVTAEQGAVNVTAEPGAVASSGTILSPTVLTQVSTTATPNAVLSSASILDPTISAQQQAVSSPASLGLLTAVISPAIVSEQSVVISADHLFVSLVISNPAIATTQNVSVSIDAIVVQSVVSEPVVVAESPALIQPLSIDVEASILQPSVSSSSVIAPAVFEIGASVFSPSVETSANISTIVSTVGTQLEVVDPTLITFTDAIYEAEPLFVGSAVLDVSIVADRSVVVAPRAVAVGESKRVIFVDGSLAILLSGNNYMRI